MEIVATTSLPAVDRPNADRWNAARSRQFGNSTTLQLYDHIVKFPHFLTLQKKNQPSEFLESLESLENLATLQLYRKKNRLSEFLETLESLENLATLQLYNYMTI